MVGAAVENMLSAIYVTVAVNLLKYTLYCGIKHLFVKGAVLYRFNDLCVIKTAA